MWFLVKVKDQDDINKDEQERIMIKDDELTLRDGTLFTRFEGKGARSHPMTKGD